MKAWTLLLCGILGAAVGFVFFMQACVVYAGTSPDPQKPVGYVFIAFDSLTIGGAVFGFASAVLLLFGWEHGIKSVVGLLLLAVVCAAIIATILVHHWRDLFPQPRPNQAMRPVSCVSLGRTRV